MMTIRAAVLSFAMSVTFLSVGINAYKKGPPVDDPHHHHLCEDMSPQHGHDADPITNRSAPFELTASGQCYRNGSSLTVKLASTDNQMYFEGLFVLARRTSDNTTVNGQFDTNGDHQLQTLNCGYANNSIGHSEDKHYMQKVFKWTPNSDLTDPIYFIATVVHKKRQYWLGVTSSTVRYDPECVLAQSSATKTTSMYFQAIVTVLAAAVACRRYVVNSLH